MSLPPRIVRLREGLAARRGVLFIGPDFAHDVPGLDLADHIDGLRDDLSDSSGWEGLRLDERMSLASQGLGPDNLARIVGDLLPTVEVLHGVVRPFHRRLMELPFPVIVDCAVDDLVHATLLAIDHPVRVLSADADLVTRPRPLPGERTLIRLRGDLLLGEPALTMRQLARLPQTNPALFERLRQIASEGPLLFHGFRPRSPLLKWLVTALAPLSGTAVLTTRLANALWRQHWADAGFEIVWGATVPELESRVDRLCGQLDPNEALPALDAVLHEVSDVVARSLAPIDALAWAHLSPAELEERGGVVEEVRSGLRLLSALAERGLPIPPAPPALAAEVLQRASDLPGARRAVALSVQAMEHQGQQVDVLAASAVGRVLNRMGDADRARHYLERALTHGDDRDTVARADDLAWLSRCVLDRIDRLRAKKRDRAVMELIAAFLKSQARRLELARLEPGDDQSLQWSIYYINLRLGRVMGLASEMALTAGEVYAGQAINLLTRAVELAPFKPDAYRFLRPLLTDRRSRVADPRRWMALVASAPPQVQRRLGGR